MFKNLADRWNVFSGKPFPEEIINSFKEKLLIGQYDLKSVQAIEVGGNPPWECFQGWAEYVLDSQIREEIIALQTLANFAFFSGIGYKTTQGFGQSITAPMPHSNFKNAGTGNQAH